MKISNRNRLQDIVDLYGEGLTLQQVGDIYGLTRERIRQILNFAFKEGFQVKKLKQYLNTPCIDCGKILTTKHGGSRGKCAKCTHRFQNPGTKHREDLPKECIRCGKTFTDTFRRQGKGACNRCYDWLRYNLMPEYRARLKVSQRKYYLKSKEKIRTRNLLWRKNNPEKLKEIYQRRKLKRLEELGD